MRSIITMCINILLLEMLYSSLQLIAMDRKTIPLNILREFGEMDGVSKI